eukprot:127113-Chlamydomonas_euryale.AAC.3
MQPTRIFLEPVRAMFSGHGDEGAFDKCGSKTSRHSGTWRGSPGVGCNLGAVCCQYFDCGEALQGWGAFWVQCAADTLVVTRVGGRFWRRNNDLADERQQFSDLVFAFAVAEWARTCFTHCVHTTRLHVPLPHNHFCQRSIDPQLILPRSVVRAPRFR